MTSIEFLFERLAFTTWDAIDNAFQHKIMFGEDAITSVNLLSLKNASFPNIIIADTRAQEHFKGCDFEFWIGNGSSGWIRYAIQAKKIYVSSERYKSLKHVVGGRDQIDILETYAKVNDAVPLYCLYNFSNSSIKPSTSCPKIKDIKEFGCSITPLETARIALKKRGSRTFDWFHSRKETLPWSCLVRCSDLKVHWPTEILGMDYEKARQMKLPKDILEMLSTKEKIIKLVDTQFFSHQKEFRPRWIGVINIKKELTQ